VNLSGLFQAVGDALAKITEVVDGTWQVFDGPVDALSPPAFVVVGGPDPMLAVASICTDDAHVQVLAVAARLEIQGTYPTAVQMVDAGNDALAAAGLRPFQTLAPAPAEIAGLQYLAARLQVRQPVTRGG
jgi:hypothetical protein